MPIGFARIAVAVACFVFATSPVLSQETVADATEQAPEDAPETTSAEPIELDAPPVEQQGEDVEPLVEEVLVTGEQPGPGLWRVSNGERTLWILGTHQPLPKKMTWRSKQVEALVAQSQEVISPGSVDAKPNIGFWRGMTLVPSLIGIRKSPDDAQLQDLLSPDVYARWLVLKKKYIGRDQGIEKFRPVVAALELRSEALEKTGLDGTPVAWPVITKTAKKHKVKITSPLVEFKIEIKEPRAVIKRFKKVQLSDVECFAVTIDNLEADIESMKISANAWASGDVAELERLSQKPPREDCLQMLMTAFLNGGDLANELGIQEMIERTKRDTEKANAEVQRLWMEAVDRALANNTTTFAVLPVRELVKPDGRLAKLREKGYTIEAPETVSAQ
jgi:uncharacterized protein YbaP (TraB family)